mmetsp:Transcript_10484/g.24802  ORF Transcript_10484/g.24802 Transcript_10484/m.24802 type:complete len:338 (+) Transcript_10484:1798-2811(+)
MRSAEGAGKASSPTRSTASRRGSSPPGAADPSDMAGPSADATRPPRPLTASPTTLPSPSVAVPPSSEPEASPAAGPAESSLTCCHRRRRRLVLLSLDTARGLPAGGDLQLPSEMPLCGPRAPHWSPVGAVTSGCPSLPSLSSWTKAAAPSPAAAQTPVSDPGRTPSLPPWPNRAAGASPDAGSSLEGPPPASTEPSAPSAGWGAPAPHASAAGPGAASLQALQAPPLQGPCSSSAGASSPAAISPRGPPASFSGCAATAAFAPPKAPSSESVPWPPPLMDPGLAAATSAPPPDPRDSLAPAATLGRASGRSSVRAPVRFSPSSDCLARSPAESVTPA